MQQLEQSVAKACPICSLKPGQPFGLSGGQKIQQLGWVKRMDIVVVRSLTRHISGRQQEFVNFVAERIFPQVFPSHHFTPRCLYCDFAGNRLVDEALAILFEFVDHCIVGGYDTVEFGATDVEVVGDLLLNGCRQRTSNI